MSSGVRLVIVAGAIFVVTAASAGLRQAWPSGQAQQPVPTASGSFDSTITQNAQRMIEEAERSSASTPSAMKRSGAISSGSIKPSSGRSSEVSAQG